jgi:DNA-directed RNA polymerase specialized sigma24 family protein
VNIVEHPDIYKNALLSNADLCYSVAFTLTRDPDSAHDLARDVLDWAWSLRSSRDASANLKSKLLTMLRRTYLSNYSAGRRPARYASGSLTQPLRRTSSR